MKGRLKVLLYNFITSATKTIARLIIFLHKRNSNKKLWLLGGYGGKAYGDNAAALFEYVNSNEPDIDAYWVIRRNSKDIKKVKGKYIYKESIKSYMYCLLADTLIVSHGLSDLANLKTKDISGATKVYLSHGLHGFKKATNYSLNEQFDIFTVTSEFQKEILQKHIGVRQDKIKITGLPRYDNLTSSRDPFNNEQGVKILYMPTWRDWLNRNNIDGSDYATRVKSIISDKKLSKILSEHNCFINIYFHIYMYPIIGPFLLTHSNPRVKILPLETDLQKEIKTSDILITDYSSVAWDFLFMNKDIIYYQFDSDEYIKYRGSYVPFNNNLFGIRAQSQEDLTRGVSELLEGKVNNSIENNKEYWKNKAFKYSDHDNSKRVFESILKR